MFKKKIEKLNKEQEALMPIVRDEWINLGLRAKFDKEECEASVKWLYYASSLKEPKVVFVKGPQDLAKKFSASVKDSVRDSVWDSVGDSVRDSVGDSVRVSVRASVWASVGDSVGDSVWASVRDSVWASVWASVRDSVWASVGDSVWDSVRDSVWDSVGDSVRVSVSGCSLCYDAEFGAWYEYWKQIKAIKAQDKADKYVGYLRTGAFYALFFEKVAFIMECPNEVHQKKLGNRVRLHNPNGPALLFKDGTELYRIHGVEFDEKLFKKVVSGKMKFKEIMKLSNIEQRMVALKIKGAETLLKETKAKLLNKSERGNELYLVKGVFRQDAYYLKYSCPSTGRVYISGVDPEAGHKKDADEAMAWKFNLTKEQYQNLKVEA